MKKLLYCFFCFSFLLSYAQQKVIDFESLLSDQQKLNEFKEGTIMPSALYSKYRQNFSPNNTSVALNPTTYFWNSLNESKASYIVEFSMDSTFQKEVTTKITKHGFLNLHKKQKAGTWFWRIKDSSKSNWSPINSYTVLENTVVYETPYFEEFIQRIPKSHPYILTLGASISEIKNKAKRNPEISNTILEQANALVSKNILHLKNVDDSKYTKRNFLHNVMHPEVKKLSVVLKAYLVSGEEKYFINATSRVEELLTWSSLYHLEEMFKADMLTKFAQYYDLFYDQLDAGLKNELKIAAEEYLSKMNKKWIGVTENRQYDNHFWQKELAGFSTLALTYFKESDIAKTSLEYAYGIFLAKSPVLGGNEGGWANGISYFGVNTATVIDLAYLFYKVGNVPVFDKPWYQNLSEYYLYCSPAGAPMNGFGDMHDRRSNSGLGAKHSMYMHHILGDPVGLYQFYKTYNPKKDRSIDNFFLTSGVKYLPNNAPILKDVKQDKVFSEVGEVAFHTDILNPKNDIGLYFRSSPFGANGHMHANQNAFNLSYKGEKVFYSSGYYTSFADAHSLTSYKHTRAHNGITINGKGQAYGNEGYGWLKKQLSGENIAYVCGDASQAYKKVVDNQWLGYINKYFNNKTGTIDDNFEDIELNTFDRHIVLLRDAEIVLIYDVIEAKEEISTQLLMHAPKKFYTNKNNSFETRGENGKSLTHVFSSSDVLLKTTDTFFVKPVDFKKKYKKGVPNQFHINFETTNNSKQIKYLTVVQLGGKNDKLPKLKLKGDKLRIGEYEITVNLKENGSQKLHVVSEKSDLYIGNIPTKVKGVSIKNSSPSGVLLVEKNKSNKLMLQGAINTKPKIR